jgi:hypothetical protein
MLDEGYNVDLNDTSGIDTDNRSNYKFIINDKRYIVKFYDFGNHDYEVKFGIDKNGLKDIDMTNDMTVSSAKEVMVNVAKSIILFIKQNRPRSIKYVTDRKSRERQYKRLVNILMASKLFGYHLEHYDDNIHYIISDKYTIRDIIK